MWKRYEKTMIENSNIQNFIFVSLQLDRHIITEFDKMKIDIYAIRIFTFYLRKISFLFYHQHFRLNFIAFARVRSKVKKFVSFINYNSHRPQTLESTLILQKKGKVY